MNFRGSFEGSVRFWGDIAQHHHPNRSAVRANGEQAGVSRKLQRLSNDDDDDHDGRADDDNMSKAISFEFEFDFHDYYLLVLFIVLRLP